MVTPSQGTHGPSGNALDARDFFFFKLNVSACVLSRFSRGRLFATLWTVARQAPLSMGFSRQEDWSGLPFPPPGESSQPRDQTCIS